jgi:hypothetical protein
VRRPLSIVAGLAVLVALSPGAHADGDPASDYLLFHTLYTSIAQQVPGPQLHRLQAAIAGANQSGFPIRVALILDRIDLGAYPQLFHHQAHYAQLLAGEEKQVFETPILVVLPTGAAVSNITPLAPAQDIVGAIPVTRPATATSLALAATTAVRELAAAQGHPIRPAGRNWTRIGGAFAAGVVVFLSVAWAVNRRRRR